MLMHKDDIAQYPRCAALLQRTPGAIKGTRIFDAFVEACTLPIQTNAAKARRIAVDRGLRWAVGPMIVPSALVLKSKDACGYFPTYLPPFDRVLVTDIWFKGYEFGLAGDQEDAARRLVQTTLHEVVHWVREAAGASPSAMVGGEIGGHHEEAGEYFAEKAYGSRVCTDAELLDAQMTSVAP